MMPITDMTAHATAKRRRRSWQSTTAIVLHQTACEMGESPSRFVGSAAHFFVTRKGKIIQIHPIDSLTWHSNATSVGGVGIEIDGHYAGVEGDLRTYWHPTDSPERTPLHPSPAQIASSLELVRYIVHEVAAHGGQIEHVLAHRQSSATRRSDPGSEIWQAVAMPIMLELGLDDGGDGWKVGSGRAIPREWDSRRTSKY